MTIYKPRYEGIRWAIVYGSYEGVEHFALNELQAMVQKHLPYVVGTHADAGRDLLESNHLIVLGTAKNNKLVEQAISERRIAPPAGQEGYTLAYLKSPWSSGKNLIVIAGADANGVLYGVQSFIAGILSARLTPDNPLKMRQVFDEMKGMEPFTLSEQPAVTNRGIWTWGYVIYDYRRFIDNMARLKLNMITIWNDCPPVNIREVIAYAHSRGIRVILGFPWGWGLAGIDISKKEDRDSISADVLAEYHRNYRGLGMDGIYFQTLTEHRKTVLGGRTVASLACELVNNTARALLAEEPDLLIQFGLHATSILDNYVDLKDLDPRVVIVWEDAGAIPFSYETKLTWPSENLANPSLIDTTEHTLEYSKKLATFRPGTEFAIVPKGWINLRWGDEFEHHGPFVLGERDRDFIRKRLEERQPHWDKVNTRWMRHYSLAMRFYREILDCHPVRMTAVALVEDGMFEEAIQPSVALFAETVWNPRSDPQDILDLALSPYYRLTR